MKDKDELKNSLTLDDMEQIVAYLGGEPIHRDGLLVCRTICHGGDSHKLYYYDNSHLFKCFTACPEDYFDIFALVQKVQGCTLPQAIQFVLSYFGLSFEEDFLVERTELQDWQIFNKYEANKQAPVQKNVSLKAYDSQILQHFSYPRIKVWEDEGISPQVMQSHGICYNASAESIVIPHFDISGQLIGIRERTLVKENEVYGKYRPVRLNRITYSHPLSFNLYNINNSKHAIHTMQKAIVFEGEKSPLLFASMFGEENDISVACCGSALIAYQVESLLSLGVNEIVVAFDKQFKEIGDEEFKKWTKKLVAIHNKYSSYVTISFMFDKEGILQYKSSPIDEGKDKFLQLYESRIFL